jgi:uncharacterized protein
MTRLLWRSSVVLLAFALTAVAVYKLSPPRVKQRAVALARGVWIDDSIRIATPDGQMLAASLYRPLFQSSPLPTVLIRLPYNRFLYNEQHRHGVYFARHGFTVLTQDLRGTGQSTGAFAPWRHATQDGVTTLDWIGKQPWSTGKVGTLGCSALGEVQLALARARHPQHAAMIAQDAGGGMGHGMGNHSHIGFFEGGVLQLASSVGWYLEHGFENRATPVLQTNLPALHRALPVSGLISQLWPARNAYQYLFDLPLADSTWRTFDFTTEQDRPATPAMIINTWGDQSIDGAFGYMELLRKTAGASSPHRMILAPGVHCSVWDTMQSGKFGELEARNSTQPYTQWYRTWFDYWLKNDRTALHALPPYLLYVVGEHRWITATQWPPAPARLERWPLHSTAGANSARGDGQLLSPTTPVQAQKTFDEWIANPADPVPSIGGPVCCTGNDNERTGPADQAVIEQRGDVLVYTSAPLKQPLRIAGPLRARLIVSSTARDTDIVARITDVWPDGRSISIQEGALRLRYRNGYENPTLLEPGQPAAVTVPMRSIAYYLPAGHRLRLHIASSSFPRLARNLQGGAARADDETQMNVARNRVYLTGPESSALELYVLDDAAVTTFTAARQ